MAQVFISYSRKDVAFVEQLAADLKKAGMEVWYDVSGLRGGSHWQSEIEKALKNSQYAIFVISPDSVESEWVNREFLFASNRNLTLVPLMYRACELPLSFLDLNYIDVQGNKYKENFDKILLALNQEAASLLPEKERKIIPQDSFRGKKTYSFSMIGLVLVALGMAIGSIFLSRGTASPEITITPTSTVGPTDTPFTPEVTKMILPASTSTPQLSSDFWITYTLKDSNSNNIYNINPGTNAIIPIVTSKYNDKVGTWSHDGLLAFERMPEAPWLYYQIFLYDGNGETKKLTNYTNCSNWAPAWSPDGKKIVFYSSCKENKDVDDKQRDIYIMDSSGKGRVKLTNNDSDDMFPAFSPDGKYITFTSRRNGRYQIFIMDVDGENQRYITDGCGSTFSPLVGEYWLWFSSECDEDGEIRKININDINSLTVIKINKVSDDHCSVGQNPSLSPDGNYVVFQSDTDICIMGNDGSNARPLTSGSAPSWKP